MSTTVSLAACQQSVAGRQLDVQYANTIGTGSALAAPIKLPHGKYTIFASSDPPSCLKALALLDHTGKAVFDDGNQRQAIGNPAPGPQAGQQMMPTFVQQELQSGTYQLRVTSRDTTCAWNVQQVLNSVLSDEAPLKPTALPKAPAVDFTFDNGSTEDAFEITSPGIYEVRSSVTPCAAYSLNLVREGNIEPLAAGTAAPVPPGSYVGPQGSDGPMFLGAGHWRVSAKTTCFWAVEVKPWKGSLGGGTYGFAS